jgi:20S proteasome subunit alpha 2
LYNVHPSGFFWAWKASAIGKNIVNVKIFGGKRHNNDIGLDDGIYTALFTLKEGFEVQITEKTKEMFCAVL